MSFITWGCPGPYLAVLTDTLQAGALSHLCLKSKRIPSSELHLVGDKGLWAWSDGSCGSRYHCTRLRPRGPAGCLGSHLLSSHLSTGTPSRPPLVHWSPVPTIPQPTMGSNTFCYSLQHTGSGGNPRGCLKSLPCIMGWGWGGFSWALPLTPCPQKSDRFSSLLGCPTPVWESYHCHSTCHQPSGQGEASPRTPFSVTHHGSALCFPTILLPSEQRCAVSGSRELAVSSVFLFLRSGP